MQKRLLSSVEAFARTLQVHARGLTAGLIIFTEYGDAKRYLVQMLTAAIAGTDDADARILQFHGGMSDEQREEVQRAFNGPLGKHPVRILIATDAAREGINLQAYCADLVHFDVPWNPGRMEQRNGRIDRTPQPSDVVRCSYFVYSDATKTRSSPPWSKVRGHRQRAGLARHCCCR